MSDDGLVYGFVWVLIAYFVGVVLFCTGWFNGNQEWIWYGLYCFLIGLGFNISYKLGFVVDVLTGADVKFEWFDDED